MNNKLSKLIKKVLAPLVLTTSLAVAPVFARAQGEQEDLSHYTIYDPYSQPNIHILNGKDSLDYSGSGDVYLLNNQDTLSQIQIIQEEYSGDFMT